MSTNEIAQRSGLSPLKVALISEQLDWTDIDIPTLKVYTQACNLDLTNHQQMKRAHVYLWGRKRTKWSYLKRHPEWETYYLPLMIRYLASVSQRRTT